ncbi:hypothetical protein [Aerolutibacter ruishenii]|uniref:DUF3149 domain-containing protein n=1 Tax=Aerolutibacter ruishenii TaxID=686800 RepID=A0A562LGT8_9GAMM|nr:hypothetical protein [Lysobacter ruishenii]TWI06823.1 hypothetical protein IP93_02815 [Lysobacter ruishenii]
MSPLLDQLLTTPMGWLAIAVTVLSIALTVAIHLFLRRKIRESEAAAREGNEPPR